MLAARVAVADLGSMMTLPVEAVSGLWILAAFAITMLVIAACYFID